MPMGGLYYEQFSVGQRFDHVLRRTVTEADNLIFSALTHNPAALHLDEEYMKSSEFGTRIVNSCFTLSLMVGVSVADTTLGTSVPKVLASEVPGIERVRAGQFTSTTARVVLDTTQEAVAVAPLRITWLSPETVPLMASAPPR